MKFSPQQESALDAVHAWMKKKNKRVFRLFGYAGTGKTSLAKHFAAGIKGGVQYAAFTGKAAMVMRQNGCSGASTIHSLIYRPDGEEGEDDEGNPTFRLNHNGPIKDAKLIIIDECSMVDEELGSDLMSFGKPILVLGDPGQLPPLKGGGYFTSHKPDIMLEEIHRQAADNPIIRFATDAREGRPLNYGDYGDVKIISRNDVNADIVTGADQVLVGKNITRRKYNDRIRHLAGFRGQMPSFGDRLVALQNDKDKGVLNGGLWSVIQVMDAPRKSKGFIHMIVKSIDILDADPIKVKVKEDFFTDPSFKPDYKSLKGSQQFDFGYCLTTHKAQGSQWPSVCLFDESYVFGDNRSRHLYTSITRASEKLTIVK
jgi:exodeoxyribonuclease V